MRIYTKTGDKGSTGLVGGSRVSKTDLVIELVGSLDEVNAAIGEVRCIPELDPELSARLERTQNQLFDLGAEIATPRESKYWIPSVSDAEIEVLEAEIDAWENELEPLKNFILPGGTLNAAKLHSIRTIARRAERTVLRAHEQSEFRPTVLMYLNRLSDWLFVAARIANARAGVSDVPWKRTER